MVSLLAGGLSKTEARPAANVDIYTNSTDSWSLINLPQYISALGVVTPYRRNIGGVAYGTKGLFCWWSGRCIRR